MLIPDEVEALLDMQRRGYALLRWVREKVESGKLPLASLHGALDAPQAAAEWLSRNAAALPAGARPPDGKEDAFAHLFASYLVTSFEVAPTKRVWSGCSCRFCTYLVHAPNLKAQTPSKLDEQIAYQLEIDCLEALAEEVGAPLLRKELEQLVGPVLETRRQLAILTYVRELERRCSFRGQGRPVLALWREFAWKDHRPIRNFELSTNDALGAEKAVRDAVQEQLLLSESEPPR
jgi:hypothetical protein